MTWLAISSLLQRFWVWLLSDVWRLIASLLMGALLAVLVVLNGLIIKPHVGPLHFTLIDWPGWRPRAIIAERALEQVKVAQKQAAALAVKAKADAEAKYKGKADDADKQLAAARVDGDRRLADYIASHRLRPGTQGPTRPATAAADGSSTQGSDGPSAAAKLVAVSDDDLKICTINTQRLQAVHDWAIGLNK